jgi:heme iron utilization protein
MHMTEDAAQTARHFFRSKLTGILSTHSAEVEGYPFGSVVPYAVTVEGRPIILISAIAQHTKNIAKNPRVCLTMWDDGAHDKQAAGRVSIVGDAVLNPPPPEGAQLRERYLRFYPGHEKYFQTHDFFFYAIDAVRVRYIGGFGAIYWVDMNEWLHASPAWIHDELRVLNHVNEDHQDVLVQICQSRDMHAVDPQLAALDVDGCHLRNNTGLHYVPFASPCMTAEAIRDAMISLK